MSDKKAFFNEQAAGWDSHFQTPEQKKRLEESVRRFHLTTGSKIIDVGSGTGGIIPYLLQASEADCCIRAIDFAEEMVKIARKKFEGERRVSFTVASVESLPFESRVFDHAVCFGAFPHFEGRRRALQEMGRVLKVRSTLIIAHALSRAEIRHHHQNCGPVSRDFLPDEFEMKSLLEEEGFRVKRLLDQPKCYLCEAMKLE